jgi:hypothetical protein
VFHPCVAIYTLPRYGCRIGVDYPERIPVSRYARPQSERWRCRGKAAVHLTPLPGVVAAKRTSLATNPSLHTVFNNHSIFQVALIPLLTLPYLCCCVGCSGIGPRHNDRQPGTYYGAKTPTHGYGGFERPRRQQGAGGQTQRRGTGGRKSEFERFG